MLTEDRHARIVELVMERGSVTVPELAELLGISASTIRRDLEKLDVAHRLVKVHGGATSLDTARITRDVALTERYKLHVREKQGIASYAARLVGTDDFVYIDAGSTTEDVIAFLSEPHASYVTNSVSHARKLVARGMHVVVLGGELKSTTEALVGPEALDTLSRMNFSLGFWGTNGISIERGLTTPDRSEALVKRRSLECCERCYVLADASKFDRTAPITFARLSEVTVLTDHIPAAYRDCDTIMEITK